MAQQAVFSDVPLTDGAFTTDMSVGEILRRSRLHYKQTLNDIERELHIKPPQIEAIENDRFDLLPGRVYAIGFVRSYSEHLGLDGDKMVGLFKAQSQGKSRDPELHFPVCSTDSKLPSFWLVAASAIALVGGSILWGVSHYSDTSSVRDIPPVPENLREVEASVPAQELQDPYFELMGPPAPVQTALGTGLPDAEALNAMAPAAGEAMQESVVAADSAGDNSEITPPPETMEVAYNNTVHTAQAANTAPGDPPMPSAVATPVAAPPVKGLVLKVVSDSWVEIKDGAGQTLVSRVLKAGEEYFIPDRPNLSLSMGNAAGISFEIDGQKLRPFGNEGQVVRALNLDLNYLKTNYAAADIPQN